jgi:hypothetical protein
MKKTPMVLFTICDRYPLGGRTNDGARNATISLNHQNKKGRIKMKVYFLLRAPAFAVLLTFFLLPAAAHAANVTVGCPGGTGGTYTSIGAALAAIGQTGPSNITVTGTCQENVSLNNAQSITIAAPTPGGAAIVGPLDTDAFDISLSQGINLVNLDISGTYSNTGNGGGAGVYITDASEVHIISCTVHDNQVVGVNADTGSHVFLRSTIIQNNTPYDGLDLFDGSTADVTGSIIQYNGSLGTGGTSGVFAGRNSDVIFRGSAGMSYVQYNADMGIEVRNQSNVAFGTGGITVQGNQTNGISVETGSHLQVNSPKTIVQGNGAACPLDPACGGILATENSTVTLDVGTVSGNQGAGVSVQLGATISVGSTIASMGTATISNNSGDGIHFQWDSTGKINAGNTITGNGGASVFCDGGSLVVADLSTFSKVRCGDVQPPNGRSHADMDKDRRR